MPRFIFHLENTATPLRDTEGAEVDGVEAAECHAVKIFAEARCERPGGFWEAETDRITLTDATGLTPFTICMMSVIAPAFHQPGRPHGAR
jgi:hypothetical protein